MVLESLTNQEPGKIRNLTVESPEREQELMFDPERDITDEDWKELKLRLELNRSNKRWDNFSKYAMTMKIFFPKRAKELKLDDEAWQGIKEDLESSRGQNWDAFSLRAMEMKILFPERAEELDLNEEAWQGMKKEMESRHGQRSNFFWYGFARQAMEMKILVAEEVCVTDCGLEITMRKKKVKHRKQIPPLPEQRKF